MFSYSVYTDLSTVFQGSKCNFVLSLPNFFILTSINLKGLILMNYPLINGNSFKWREPGFKKRKIPRAYPWGIILLIFTKKVSPFFIKKLLTSILLKIIKIFSQYNHSLVSQFIAIFP